MVRKPFVAGMFYEEGFDALDKQITECFKSKFGPGELPIKRRDKKIIGIIAPHAGYQFSGSGQAWCYKEIGESKFAETYVILGTAHSGFPQAAITTDEFETPFGIVSTDKRFIDLLIEKGVAIEDRLAQQLEQSIEVKLPLLQLVNKEY